MAEWRQIAGRLAESHTILLYERAGYGTSSVSCLERTPENIATELYQLLKQVEHTEKITILAHSLGGLYAWKFAKLYPKMVEKLVLLDPLSPEEYRFRMELTEEEFKKSGADKTQGLQMNLRLTRKHLGWMVRMLMRKAPPFYYYNEFLKEEREKTDRNITGGMILVAVAGGLISNKQVRQMSGKAISSVGKSLLRLKK